MGLMDVGTTFAAPAGGPAKGGFMTGAGPAPGAKPGGLGTPAIEGAAVLGGEGGTIPGAGGLGAKGDDAPAGLEGMPGKTWELAGGIIPKAGGAGFFSNRASNPPAIDGDGGLGAPAGGIDVGIAGGTAGFGNPTGGE